MSFLLFVGSVALFVYALKLGGRVRRLEELQGTIPQATPGSSTASSQSTTSQSIRAYISERMRQGARQDEIRTALLQHGWQPAAIDAAFASLTGDASPPSTEKSQTSDRFIAWLKEDWLLKLGAMLLLIGFGWLTTYAFLNNWIGPMGRIALGIIAGTLFIALGWWRIKAYIHQGGVFLVLGSTTILLTLFAARALYDFFTPFSALTVMFLSTAFVALASVRYNNRALSLASLILASVAPFLTNAPSPSYPSLFLYLFIVILGTIWIVVLTGQRELTAAALTAVALYSVPHLIGFTSADKGALLLFAYAFVVVFFITNSIGILKLRGKELVPDLVTAAGNGLLLLAWIMTAAPDEWQSLIIAAWMLVFSVGAFLLFRLTGRREPLYVYAGVGVAMLAAATSAELDGAALTIAYTIESGLVSLIAYAILRDVDIAHRTSILLIGPMLLSLASLTSSAWSMSVFNKDFFVLLVLGATLMGLGLTFYRDAHANLLKKETLQFNAAYFIAGSVYLYILLWYSLHAWLEKDSTAVMLSLLVYTIVGIAAYFYGHARGSRGVELYGGALVGFVVGRMLLVDVWQMELAGRIVTFFAIGALLVSTAFLARTKNEPPAPAHTSLP